MEPRPDSVSVRPETVLGLIFAVLAAALAILCRRELFFDGGKPVFSRLAVFAMVWLAGVLVTLWKPVFSAGAGRTAAIAYALLSPLLIFLAGERMTNGGVFTGNLFTRYFGKAAACPKLLIINLILLFLVVFAFISLTGSLRVGPWLAAFLYLIYCAANLYVTVFRGNAILAADLTVLSTAADVAGSYRIEMRPDVFRGIEFFYLFFVIGLKLRHAGIVRGPQKRLLLALAGIALFVLGGHTLVFTDFLQNAGVDTRYFKAMSAYRENGVAATLARSIGTLVIQEPEGYSEEAALAILDAYPEIFPGTYTRPDVLVIIDESFADMKLVGDFSTNQDEMPFFHALEKNSFSGTAFTSAYGGMTANSEFEFLTGCSMGLLDPSVVPFQLYINREIPSAATRFRELGYQGLSAMHPHSPENYRRNKTYPLLGFSRFIHAQNVPVELDRPRGYASDASDFENLIALYEEARNASGDPVFLYNMTVQNHSPYIQEDAQMPIDTFVQGAGSGYPDVDLYLTLIHASDRAFEKLIRYFEQREEPVALLFVGDHQPALDESFLAGILHTPLEERSVSQSMSLYEVPYVIWSNFDLAADPQALHAGRTSMNYMQINLLRACGLPLTAFQSFLADMQEEIPVINAHRYLGSDGQWYRIQDKASPYYEWIHQYEILQYYYLVSGEKSS